MTYKVPFINYSPRYHALEKKIDAAVKRVLNSGDFILRKDVQDLEKI